MRIWLSKTSAVSLQEQLKTQIVLGIVSADLPPGERLPSTSEIGRRFRIHPNTVRAAYRALAAAGWVDRRQGSGVLCPEPGARRRVGSRVGTRPPDFNDSPGGAGPRPFARRN